MLGTSLGPYRLDRELGSGGMGKVYAAIVEGRAPGLDAGTRIALKIVHPQLLETPGFFRRFLREAEIGKSVVHENVVRTHMADAILANGVQHHFLVMEYVEGQTLRALLTELERIPEELCRHIGREVARGLSAIHAAGVVHRDLKPENVLITADHHTVKVMDLGVARLADETIRLSQSGAFVGSVEYAAPEQFGAKEVGAAADLHALGVVLYELATAQHPYRADSFRGVMRKVLDGRPRRPAEINPQISPFFEELVLQLLEKDPARRIGSATDLAQILDEGEKSAWWKEKAKAIRVATRRPLRRIRIPRETALYGREAELAKLRALYDKAKSGEGPALLVEGEAGIGKSRLVDEFVGYLALEGDVVNFLYGSYPPGGAATASGAFSSAYGEHFGEDGCTAYLGQTPILATAFDALLRGEPTPTGAEPLTKDSLQAVFVHATRNLAAERTTIVLIDDLHFAPEEGRALFMALALAVSQHRILLVGTSRPGIDEKWLAGADRVGVARMQLTRLGPKDLGRLLLDALKSERTASALAIEVATKSDGNPFFLFEILRGLREGQFLARRDDGTWVTTRAIENVQVPSSVLDLVNARVADLDADERNALDVASCLGFEFDASVVADALGIGRIPLLQRLAHVEKRHRLVRSVGRRFAFDHHQVQEALYGALPEMLREEYHGAIGAAMEATGATLSVDPKDIDGALCVELADHFLRGGRGRQAVRYVSAALAYLKGAYLADTAARLAERALSVPELYTGAERVQLLLERARVLHFLGRNEDVDRVLVEARGLAGSTGDWAAEGEIEFAYGNRCFECGRFDEARDAVKRSAQLARAGQNRLAEASAIGMLGRVAASSGNTDEAEAMLRCWADSAAELGDAASEASALNCLGNDVLRESGRVREARACFERARDLAERCGNRALRRNAIGNLGMALGELGETAEARRLLELAAEESRAMGQRAQLGVCHDLLAVLASESGDGGKATEHRAQALEIFRETGLRWREALTLGNSAHDAFYEGRLSQARDISAKAVEMFREMGNVQWLTNQIGFTGAIERHLGRHDAASAALTEGLDLARRTRNRRVEGTTQLRLAELYEDLDDDDAAEAALDECVRIRRDLGRTDDLESALRARATYRMEAGRADAARADAAEAAALADELRSDAKRASAALVLRLLGDDSAAPLGWLASLASTFKPVSGARYSFHLWQATRDPTHLAEAKRCLDVLIEHAPLECHERMLTNVRLYREIVAACKAAGL